MITDKREKAKCKTFQKGKHYDQIYEFIHTHVDADDNDLLTKKYTIIIQPLIEKNDTKTNSTIQPDAGNAPEDIKGVHDS